MAGICLRLSASDIEIAKEFSNRMKPVEQGLIEKRGYTTSNRPDWLDSYYVGACAEIAFAHAAGFSVESILDKAGKGDLGVDFKFLSPRAGRETTIDVKTRSRVTCTKLTWSKDKMREPYLGRMADILVHSAFDNRFAGEVYIHLRGWCTGKWFKDNWTIAGIMDSVDTGTGFVHQDQLRDIYELVNAIRQVHGKRPMTASSATTD